MRASVCLIISIGSPVDIARERGLLVLPVEIAWMILSALGICSMELRRRAWSMRDRLLWVMGIVIGVSAAVIGWIVGTSGMSVSVLDGV